MSRSRKARRPETGTSHGREARRARRARRLLKTAAVLVAATLLGGLVAGGLLFSNLHWGGSATGPKTAAIVDQLSLTQPNRSFVEAAVTTLEQAGYAVDYYPGEEVTVDFYRGLPTHDYDLIVLRVHSGLVRQHDQGAENGTLTEYVGLFTGEPYDDDKYGGAAGAGRLGVGVARYSEDAPPLFAVTPYFIESTMERTFDGTVLILMGCDGLKSDRTAESFIEKGAQTFVSWSGKVSASHTDSATERLLYHLVIDKLATPEAVEQTMAEIGPDPSYGSTLLYYP